MLNAKAFAAAQKSFRFHGGVVDCLRRAIAAYKAEEAIQHTLTFSGLSFATADDADGKTTILVISGFFDADAINTFITDAIHAPGK